MALQHGKNQDSSPEQPATPPSLSNRIIRLTGFSLLAGAAMAILAGVVLLPLYAHNMALQHKLECRRLRIEGEKETLVAMDKFIDELRENEILISRLGRSRIGLFPNNEVVVLDTNPDGEIDPTQLKIKPVRYPPPPNNRAIEMGRKLESPPTRRGLLVLAAAMIVSSMLIFPSPRLRNDQHN